MLVEYMSQSIAHALIAACVVQALLRAWRIREPDLRVAFRMVPLLFPTLVLPAFLLFAPWRSGDAFRDGTALFAGSRWSAVSLAGLPVNLVVFSALVTLGLALLLIDLVRIVAGRRQAIAALPPLRGDARDALGDEVARLARVCGAPVPRVVAVESAAPLLFVTGLRRPALVVSRGVLDRLDARERRAALVHELMHVIRRDQVTGWALLACRVLLAFNPAAQIVARAAARELEWRADALAARATGDGDALASALAKLSGGERRAAPATRIGERFATDLLHRGRLAAVAQRRERLLHAPADAARGFGVLRLAGASGGLALLLFFVV